jgi:hypothetical protein
MSSLDRWLQRAMRGLSAESSARVRSEITEHYESALAAAMDGGATRDEADLKVLSDLGDAGLANRRYRKVLLTTTEARMLREVEEEYSSCRPWVAWLLRATSVGFFCASATAFVLGHDFRARALLVAGTACTFFLAVPTIRAIYTPIRARRVRWIKWVTLTVVTGAVALGPWVKEWFAALAICACGIAWTEWVRSSIRRKLPVEKWPRTLYL